MSSILSNKNDSVSSNVLLVNTCKDLQKLNRHRKSAIQQVKFLEKQVLKLILRMEMSHRYRNALQEITNMELIILEGVLTRFNCYVELCSLRIQQLK